MPLDVGELLSTGTALCHNFMSHSRKLAQQCCTRNKLVIGCIDRSSANISFVPNSPVPYNCLQISRQPIMDHTIANKYYRDLQMGGEHILNRCCSKISLEVWNPKDLEKKAGAKVVQQNPQKDWLGYKHKWGSLWTQWRIFGFYSTLFLPKFSHIEIFLEFNYITRRFLTVVSRQTF